MTRRRWLGLAVATGGTLALSAPAAQATVDTTLTFGAGTVHVVDTGPTADTVRFTMAVDENLVKNLLSAAGTLAKMAVTAR